MTYNTYIRRKYLSKFQLRCPTKNDILDYKMMMKHLKLHVHSTNNSQEDSVKSCMIDVCKHNLSTFKVSVRISSIAKCFSHDLSQQSKFKVTQSLSIIYCQLFFYKLTTSYLWFKDAKELLALLVLPFLFLFVL